MGIAAMFDLTLSRAQQNDRQQRCAVDSALEAVEQFLTRHKMLRAEIRAGNVRVGDMALQAISPPQKPGTA